MPIELKLSLFNTLTASHYIHLKSCILQIVAESVELLEHEVDVLLGLGLVGDDGPEEVGELAQGLVTDHHAARLHHPTLREKRIMMQSWQTQSTFVVCPCHKINHQNCEYGSDKFSITFS